MCCRAVCVCALARLFVFVFVALLLAGCIPPDERDIRFRGNAAAPRADGTDGEGEGDLVIEELDAEPEASKERRLPSIETVNRTIDAADTRLGALYEDSAGGARLRPCAQSYTDYILGTTDVATTPPQEDAQPNLVQYIAEIRALEKPPVSTRIGKEEINSNNTAALMPILITTENGYAIGELECRLNEDAWELYAFVIDLEDLASERPRAQNQFDPLLF